MTEIYEVGDCTIVQGDNLEVLLLLDDNSIDSCVTDPPYGIGFMNKKWDTFTPGVGEARVVTRDLSASENPNLKGRKTSPATSMASVEYDRTLAGQRGFQVFTEIWAREVFRVLKPGGHLLVCGAPRSFHRMASGLEDAGFEVRDCLMWLFGQGFPKSHNLTGKWGGWGTALKPGWEPIAVARKPLSGTVAANVERFGTGALNIDATRIPIDDAAYAKNCSGDRGHDGTRSVDEQGATDLQPGGGSASAIGRWPANVAHDGSVEVLEGFPTVASGKPCGIKAGGQGNAFGKYAGGIPVTGFGDAGSAARFFYCAKTSKKDRDEGMDNEPDRIMAASNQAQAELKRGNLAQGNSGMNTAKQRKNNHPTVKPTALMQWLARLVTPPGGVVLDPFFGSGSTGKACAMEGFRCIGIEREADYVAIARARISHAVRNFLTPA